MMHPTAIPPIDCNTAVRRLWDFLDEELDESTFAAVEAHVAACAKCAAHVDFARAFLASLRTSWRAEDNDDTIHSQSLRSRVVSRLEEQGFRAP